jgi:transglutaminase-like putative cysteine protease
MVTLLFFTWSALEPWNLANAAQSPPQRQSSAATSPQKAAGKFEDTIRALKKKVAKLDQQGQVENLSKTSSDLDSFNLDIDDQLIGEADTEVLEQFRDTEAKIKAAGLPAEILQRHQQVVAEYKANAKTLRQHLSKLKQLRQALSQAKQQATQTQATAKRSELGQQIRDLSAFLTEKVKEPKHTPLDPNNLPFRAAEKIEHAPRLKPEQFTELWKPVQLAFNSDSSSLLQLVQANSNLPKPEDLSETVEVQFTQDIRNLAAQLNNDPVKIYEYVRNNFDFEPTYGSIKGAHYTLLTKSGNATDLASLLIALLRVSGIPARYVFGTVEIPIAQVMNWVGVKDPSAGNVLGTGGIPAVAALDAPPNQGGKIASVRLEHTWVTAYIDYVSSRGAKHGDGDTWVELDPAFKQFDRTEGLNIDALVPLDLQNLVNQIAATGIVDESKGSATGFNETLVRQILTDRQATVESFLSANLPNATAVDIVGTEKIRPQTFGLLPASLPYRVIVQGGSVAEVPDSLRHRLQVQIFSNLGLGDLGEADLDYEAPLSSLVGNRLTLSYIPASDSDRQVVEASRDSLPAYLIHIVPILKLDGVEVARGTSVQLGTTHTLTLSFPRPHDSDSLVSQITAGSYYAIGLNLQTIAKDTLEQLQTEFTELDVQLNSDPNSTSVLS